MTPRAKYTWSAAIICILLLGLTLWYFWPPAPARYTAAPSSRDPGPASAGEDRSVVISDRFPPIGEVKVENGSAFDRASLDVSPYKVLVLPDDAEVRQGAPDKALQIFMRKVLAYHGHPSERMSVSGERKNMGCAVNAEGDMLTVATFGEWDSHEEGGALMGLLFIVPEGVEVRRQAGLSGEHSAGREWHGVYLTKPKDAKGGYWYGPASPADGWSAVPDIPDTERRAGEPPLRRHERE
jgi:hypothetical protein